PTQSAGVGCAASTAARLADVVRRAGELPAQPLVREPAGALAPQHPGRDPAARAQSFPGRSAALCPRPALRIPLRDLDGTSGHRRMVEAGGARRIFAGDIAGELRAPLITRPSRRED